MVARSKKLDKGKANCHAFWPMSHETIVKRRVKTISSGSIVLGRKALIKLLQNAIGSLAIAEGIPNDAKIVFRVPDNLPALISDDCELIDAPIRGEERGLLEVTWNYEETEA